MSPNNNNYIYSPISRVYEDTSSVDFHNECTMYINYMIIIYI